MVLVKVLKRKDAFSVIAAILMAMIIQQPLYMLTGKPASIISGVKGNQGYFYGPGGDWKSQYLFPVVWVVVQLIALEILAWILILGKMPLRRKK